MPFKSKAQEKFLYSQHPDIAKRWQSKYGQPKDLPGKVSSYQGMIKKEKK